MKGKIGFFVLGGMLAISGCGGSGTVGGGGGISIGSTPLLVNFGAPGTLGKIAYVSPDGKMVGQTAKFATAGAFWTSPGTSPTGLVPLKGDATAFPQGVNSAGIIVGFSAKDAAGTGARPVYWNGPFDAAHLLSLPTGGTTGQANSINESNEVAGTCVVNGTNTPVVWPSIFSAPNVLNGPSGATATRVSNTGVVFGFNAAGAALLWEIPSSGPQTLNGIAGDTQVTPLDMNEAGTVVGFATNAGSTHGLFWTTPGFVPQSLPSPAGQNFQAHASSSHGEFAGTGPNGAVLWAAGTLQLVDVNSHIDAGAGVTLTDVQGVFDSGVLLCTGNTSSSTGQLYVVLPN